MNKRLSLLFLLFVIGLCPIEAQTRKKVLPSLGKEGPRPTQKKYVRKASAPVAFGFQGGKNSAIRYTKKKNSTITSARDHGKNASMAAVKRPILVSLQKTARDKKAPSSKKPNQKGSSRKNAPTFEKILPNSSLTMKQRL